MALTPTRFHSFAVLLLWIQKIQECLIGPRRVGVHPLDVFLSGLLEIPEVHGVFTHGSKLLDNGFRSLPNHEHLAAVFEEHFFMKDARTRNDAAISQYEVTMRKEAFISLPGGNFSMASARDWALKFAANQARAVRMRSSRLMS